MSIFAAGASLRAQNYPLRMPTLRGAARGFPGIWSFVRTLYWQSNLELAQRHGLILLAGAMLGPAGAGMFRIAREFADVLAKPVVVVRQAVFPDLARLRHQGTRDFRGLYVRFGVLSAGIAAVVVAATGYVSGPSFWRPWWVPVTLMVPGC